MGRHRWKFGRYPVPIGTLYLKFPWHPVPSGTQCLKFSRNPVPKIFEILMGTGRYPGTHEYQGTVHADPWARTHFKSGIGTEIVRWKNETTSRLKLFRVSSYITGNSKSFKELIDSCSTHILVIDVMFSPGAIFVDFERGSERPLPRTTYHFWGGTTRSRNGAKKETKNL